MFVGIIFLLSGSKNKSAKGLSSLNDLVIKYRENVDLLGYLGSFLE